MAKKTRLELKGRFGEGDKPSGDDFANLLDSSLNQNEDGVSIGPIDRTLVLTRGLRLGDSTDAQVPLTLY